MKRSQQKSNEAPKPSTNRLSLVKTKSNETPPSKVNRLNTTTKTDRMTAIVSKVSKLTMKPKPIAKSPRVMTKKYSGKPVAIKSRSTVISHESTFCIKNIRKSPIRNRQNAENASQTNLNGLQSDQFKQMPSKQSTAMAWNTTTNSQILQEITSSVVNHSYTMKDLVQQQNSCKGDIETAVSGQKTMKSNENSPKCKSKPNESPGGRQCKEKAPVSREEIKRRLSALQRNSLKIVENNVQKARKCSIVTTSKVEVIQKQFSSGKPIIPASIKK